MIVHLIAPKNKSKWPPIWHYCFKTWESSPYKIRMWHDEDIDKLLREDDEEFFDILKTLDPIYKWDYARILIVSKWGGAYFDMDVELTSPFLDSLDPNQIYISGGAPHHDILTNWIVISQKKNIFYSFLEKGKQILLNHYSQCKQDKSMVIKTFGPAALSKFYSLSGFNDIQVLAFWHFGDPNSKFSLAKHHFTNYWH